MTSKLFEKIGINGMDLGIVLIIMLVLIIVAFVLIILNNKKIKVLEAKYESFMKGKDAKSLEDTILKRFKEVDILVSENEKKTSQIQEINEILTATFQKKGVVKYDAFHEMGGKLSFALVMLDKEDNGFVINSMHSREGCYTYIKEIIGGESYIPLGTEEKEALDKALGKDLELK